MIGSNVRRYVKAQTIHLRHIIFCSALSVDMEFTFRLQGPPDVRVSHRGACFHRQEQSDDV